MKLFKNKLGFTAIELMVVLAILLIISVPVLSIFYGSEIKDLENEFFKKIGIGKIGQYIITGILGFTAIYFRVRPDIIKAKKENRPVIGKPVKYFILLSFIGIIAFFIILFHLQN